MKKIIKYVIIDILRNRIVIGYTLFLLAISLSVFNLEDNASKGVLSLLNIILIIIPLVSLLFSAIYVYNSAEFLELLVSQPLNRRSIWLSLFAGLAGSLVLAFLVGIALPMLVFAPGGTGLMMIMVGSVLTVIFVALAMLAAVITRDKAKGIGISMLLWLYFSLLFDGMVLFLLFQFSDYPMDKWMIGISAFNPIDIGRILILLRLDESALMGFTGAVFRDVFGTTAGIAATALVLLLWMVAPAWLSVRRFDRKDL